MSKIYRTFLEWVGIIEESMVDGDVETKLAPKPIIMWENYGNIKQTTFLFIFKVIEIWTAISRHFSPPPSFPVS